MFNRKTIKFRVYLFIHILVTAALGEFSVDDIQFKPFSLIIEVSSKRNTSIVFKLAPLIDLHFIFTYRDSVGTYFNDTAALPINKLDPFVLFNGSKDAYCPTIEAVRPGNVVIGIATTDLDIKKLENLQNSISVIRNHGLEIFQQVIGWTYFLAWTVSFYPQVFLNWRRKSVEGLSFDFLAFNILGFICYSAFNIGLYAVPYIQEQYYQQHPVGVIPVQLNDVFFSVHAVAIVMVSITQCCFYKRGAQRISKTCYALLSIMIIFMLVSVMLAVGNQITWLTCLYFFSYIKLAVTFVKYMPQALYNCRRHSTMGWSIWQIIADFVGGILSIFQMFIVAHNSDDWGSVFGSPTKLGLGAFSVAFDCVFFTQHYCIFRGSSSSDEAAALTIPVLIEDDGVYQRPPSTLLNKN